MNSMLLKVLCLFLVTGWAFASARYKILQQFSHATQAEFIISDEVGEWSIDLKFDDQVKIKVNTTSLFDN